MIFPTNFSPKNKILLSNGLLIEPYKRAGIIHENGTTYTDTVRLHNYEDYDILKKWIIFHSFIFNSHFTLSEFEKSRTGKLDFTNDKLANIIDYNNVLPNIYFVHEKSIGIAEMSYTKLYDIFLKQTPENIGLVTNYLTRLNEDAFHPSRAITDTSYWQMMIYYSIVDKIIGEQKFCKSPDCNKCKKVNITHYPLSSDEWLKQRLNILIPNNPNTHKAYWEIIKAVKEHIRNKTIHHAIVPTAKNYPQTVHGQVVIYDLKKAIGDYEHDHHALMSLLHLLKDVTKFLLLERIFELKIFPIPEPSRTITIGGNVSIGGKKPRSTITCSH